MLPIPVEHPVEAYGLRISAGGATLGYSGDTAPCEGLDRVAADVRLLLREASFRDVDDNPPGIHLTGVDAGDAARAAAPRRLVLTHVPPWFDQARACSPRPARPTPARSSSPPPATSTSSEAAHSLVNL